MRGDRMEKAKVIAERKFRRKYASDFRSMTKDYQMSRNPDGLREWKERTIRMCRKTTTDCSCPMCGNPRKWMGELTRQERMA